MPALPDANASAIDALSTLELCARIDALTAELHDALAQFRIERDTGETETTPAPVPTRPNAAPPERFLIRHQHGDLMVTTLHRNKSVNPR